MGDINLDLETTEPEVYKEVVKEVKPQKRKEKKVNTAETDTDYTDLKSCLINKKIQVKFIPRNYMGITNSKHVLFGGMSENSVLILTVPVLESTGSYKNILTKEEKDFLEDYLGLEFNALSIYKKVDNYWDNFSIRLTKQGITLNLLDPNDYIKYKVLKANNDLIADSLETLRDRPRPTYKFYMTSEEEETASVNDKMDTIMKCYKEFGKYENNLDVLKCVIELIEGKPLSQNVKADSVRAKINTLIQERTKDFLKTITNTYLQEIVLIKKAVLAGLILKNGDYYYLASDKRALCNSNENPVLSVAAKYISLPKNQELRLLLEAQLNK